GAWLEELYVEPAARGRGLGSALLRAACDAAAAAGARAVDLEVERSHERAAALYRREGFRPLERTHWVKSPAPASPPPAPRSPAARSRSRAHGWGRPGGARRVRDPWQATRGVTLPLCHVPARRGGAGRDVGDLSTRGRPHRDGQAGRDPLHAARHAHLLWR